jgi:hypothetical protein
MKTIKLLSLFFLIGICFACSKEEKELTQEEEAQNLEQMFSEIENLALSVECTDPSDWAFTSYGSKACGGPWGYIAYSKNIDTEAFLSLVEEQRTAEQAYNK